jgi:hypothetical protein
MGRPYLMMLVPLPKTPGPVSWVYELPAKATSKKFVVKWDGADVQGPGIGGFTIYVSDNGGLFTIWISATSATEATFTGADGHTYSFYSIAHSRSHISEKPKTQAEATTQVPDTTPPVSSVWPAIESSPNFLVQWFGTDVGLGIRDYTISVSDNYGPFRPWQSLTQATQAWYSGQLGHHYAFESIAHDKAGNRQTSGSGYGGVIQVPAVMPANVNGDTRIDCADVALVKAAFGKKTGQSGFDPRADINKDGIVDIRDLAGVTQKLAPTTTCP